MKFFETERLIIRNVEPKDITIMFDYRNSEVCNRYQRGQSKDYEKITALIERRKNDIISLEAPFMLTVSLKETDEMVGEIVVIPRDGMIMMGYTFHYNQHRKGYAFESLSALINLLHKNNPDWQFICYVETENFPSQNLLKKLGYTELGFDQVEGALKFGKWVK